MLRLYNTLTRETEEFRPLEPGVVRMYVCGPTVYAAAHIGHGMSAIVFDVIRRYLEYAGFTVRHVMNYTDVDDKIIQRASEIGLPPDRLAEHHIQAFRQHMLELNVLPPSATPRATQTMAKIRGMILGLIERGAAYESRGDVLFRVASCPGYGRLSGRRLDELQAGSRIEVDHKKEHAMDFALWKAAKPGEPAWESPWGPGRPGWHIECSAMSLELLGEQIDIHGGGNDLVFPHHENEIAQTESFTGRPFARYWVHNGMVQLAGQKMSKSIGNLVTIEEFLGNHDPDALRLMVLNGSYRAPLTYSEQSAGAADRAADRLRGGCAPAAADAPGAATDTLAELGEVRGAAEAEFVQSMDDDFGTAGALAAAFGLVRAINSARDRGATADQLRPAQMTLRTLTGILGLRLDARKAAGAEVSGFVDLLVQLRGEARTRKEWDLADRIREGLGRLGVIIEDAADGAATWKWK